MCGGLFFFTLIWLEKWISSLKEADQVWEIPLPLEKCGPFATLSVLAHPTAIQHQNGQGQHAARDKASWTAPTGRGCLMEFQSRSRRRRRDCWGNNGWGHLSCVAALSFAYNGSGGPASGVFLLAPLLSGDTSVPYNGSFVPSPLFFCQRLTLQACSFFCLLFLFPQENKTKSKPRLFIHLFLLLFFIMTFRPHSAFAPCTLYQTLHMQLLFANSKGDI